MDANKLGYFDSRQWTHTSQCSLFKAAVKREMLWGGVGTFVTKTPRISLGI